MRQILLLCVCVSMLACSTDNKEEAKGVIPEHQLKVMEDAKNTEELMKKKLEDADKTIQEASE